MDLLQKEIARKRKELEEANLMVLYILINLFSFLNIYIYRKMSQKRSILNAENCKKNKLKFMLKS